MGLVILCLCLLIILKAIHTENILIIVSAFMVAGFILANGPAILEAIK